MKQYIFLVKKLTGKLTNDEMIEELNAAIRINFVAADLVNKQIDTVKVEAVTKFMADLADQLASGLDDDWMVNPKNRSYSDIVSKNWTSLVVAHTQCPAEVRIEIQGQSNSVNNHTVYGIVTHKDEPIRSAVDQRLGKIEFFQQNMKKILWWPWQDSLFNFSDPAEMAKLFNHDERACLLTAVVEKLVGFCNACEQPLAFVSTIG